jgi:CrcB protein
MNERSRGHLVAVLLVGAGGFLGSVSRYGIDVVAVAVGTALGGVALPLGTLTVNVVGSFALGALTRAIRRRRFRLFLATGFLSSFTTYSAFAVESVQLGPSLGTANVVATYGLGFLAALLGLTLGLGGARGGER